MQKEALQASWTLQAGSLVQDTGSPTVQTPCLGHKAQGATCTETVQERSS